MISLLLAAALTAANPVADPSPYFLDDATITQVTCPTGDDGAWLGTAFYLGNGKWMTARHVIRDEDSRDKHLFPACYVGGKKITVTEVGIGFRDYAIFTADIYPQYRAILSCNGFSQSLHYYATGYAEGNPWPVTQRLVGSGSNSLEPGVGNNEALLRGASTEGMSGGPVSDDDGVVVGLVSAGAGEGVTMEMFLPLADTSVCRSAYAHPRVRG